MTSESKPKSQYHEIILDAFKWATENRLIYVQGWWGKGNYSGKGFTDDEIIDEFLKAKGNGK